MSPNQTKETLRSRLILTLILVAGLALRLYNLDRYSIFFDEVSTLLVSQGIVLEGANQKEAFATRELVDSRFWTTPKFPQKQVLRTFTANEVFHPKTFTPAEFWAPKAIPDYYEAMTRSDIGNSPFYYALLHPWIEFFGISDYSVRFFSVIFSVMIIGLTYLFARRFFGIKTALIAAGITAIEPFFIAYSHQARNYSLTFFLTLAATYFFLQIIENKAGKRNTLWLYIGYILAAGFGLLSHFLVISVLLAHAVYALFFLRTFKGWVRIAIAAVFTLSGVTWWLMFGGGVYTLSSLQHQADLYRRMAETGGQTFGNILPATPLNVFNKSLPVFTDLVIFTNGLTDALGGKKNVAIALLAALILILWYRFKDKINTPAWLTPRFPYLLILVFGFFYSNHKLQFSILSVSLFALSFIPDLHKSVSPEQRKRLWLLYFMALIPTLFLALMSFKNGHTYGITQRYSGFSFPYMIILLSLLLQFYTTLQAEFRVLIFVFLAAQLYFVGLRLKEFYEDRSPKYGYFAVPRVPNPYMEAAKLIEATYQPGDTIYYPSPRYEITSEMDRTFLPYSIHDAQITNLYFPKDAQYIQAMDTTQNERIWIRKKGRPKPVEIMKLTGKRYGFE
ncbi:glycosyltransferase family 39 protein [Dyadobacter sp. OTU695]|uniref:glycosyltransferase family 39 protein n=1 Tax=Dyadobacter sp. OTU695 TaxID=3043860 RepID=UPI00313B86DE